MSWHVTKYFRILMLTLITEEHLHTPLELSDGIFHRIFSLSILLNILFHDTKLTTEKMEHDFLFVCSTKTTLRGQKKKIMRRLNTSFLIIYFHQHH